MKYDSVKDSGKRQEFDTGSRRDTEDGKGRFDLIPPHGMLRLARHYENGAVKYGDHNWTKGQPLSRYMSSILRHAIKYMGGCRDEDHLAAIAWNAFAMIDHEERIERELLDPSMDNMRHFPRSFLPGEFDPDKTVASVLERLRLTSKAEEGDISVDWQFTGERNNQ